MCEVFAGHLTFDDPETFLSCTYVQGSAILSYGCQLAGLRCLTADVACLLHMGTALWACVNKGLINLSWSKVKFSRRYDLLTCLGFLATLQLVLLTAL